MKRYDLICSILRKESFSERYWLLELEAPEIAALGRPGQFLNVLVEEDTVDPLLRVPLAIHSVRGSAVWVYFKKVGKATEKLTQKKTGETVRLLGPLGNGYDLEGISTEEAYLIAGGHGAAPLFFLAEKLIQKKIRTHVFLGGDRADAVKVGERFEKAGAFVQTATEDGSCGEKGLVTGCLGAFLKDRTSGGALFACGPTAMLKAITDLTKCVPTMQFSVDAYMACGIGACQGCAVRTTNGYKLACKDGPVFKAGELIL